MLAIFRCRTIGTGAWMQCIMSYFHRKLNGVLSDKLTTQRGFDFCRAHGLRRNRTDANSHIVIMGARLIEFHPHRAAQNRECDPLWTHNPFECCAFTFAAQFETECDEYIAVMV